MHWKGYIILHHSGRLWWTNAGAYGDHEPPKLFHDKEDAEERRNRMNVPGDWNIRLLEIRLNPTPLPA